MATALYRRFRPESFAEVIGQDHVTTPLRRALRAGRVGHAYLFSGPRGCGKTTSARILARCLNCAEGPTDTPCGQCDSCRDLARGGPGSLDVVEIDAASHGGVDDARELRERAAFAPARDRYKVFIIDEAHMVTSAGFNALLKLVEEPPEHVKFVFATTEPDKVIGTIRSRTHHYPFRLIPPQVLGPYLAQVCEAEGVPVGDGVLPLVVRAGGGSARDSLSVLDQLMAGAGEDGLDHATAIALLGFTDTALLDRAVEAIAAHDAGELYAVLDQVIATGHEPRRFVEDLLERFRDLIVLAAVPDRGADLLPQIPADDLERMRAQAGLMSPAQLSLCGDLVHETLATMSGATSPRVHLELLAARLVLREERLAGGVLGDAAARGAAAPQAGRERAGQHGQRGPAAGADGPAQAGGVSGANSGREEARRIAAERAEASRRARGQQSAPAAPRADVRGPQQGPAVGAQPQPAVPTAGQPEPDHQTAPRTTRPEPAQREPAQTESFNSESARPEPARPESGQPPAGGQWAQAGQSAPSAPGGQNAPSVPDDKPAPSAGDSAGVSAADVQENWSAIMDALQGIRRPSWALISQNAQVNAVQGSTLVLGFRTEGLVAAFRRGTASQNLSDAVRRILRVELTVDAVVGDGPGGSGGGEQPGGGTPGGGQPGGGYSTGGQPHGGQPGGGQTGGAPPHDAPRSNGPAGSPAQRDYAPAGAPAHPDRAPVAGPGASDRPLHDAPPYESAGGRGAALAARATQNARSARDAHGNQQAPEPEYPPEPDDPYPPDPAEPHNPYPPDPDEPDTYDAPPPQEITPPADGPVHSDATPAGPPPEVEDEGRDSLPAGEPRTYGQAALRRAIAEGRVVHSRPAQSRPGSDAEGNSRDGQDEGTRAPEPSREEQPRRLDEESAAQVPELSREEHPAPPSARQPAPSQMSHPDPAPSAPREPASTSSPEPAAAAPAATGAELARQAAHASLAARRRTAGRPAARGAQAPVQPDPDSIDDDPTGGASRDDEDAQYTSRSGREVIEAVLGGTVLEVIDETGR